MIENNISNKVEFGDFQTPHNLSAQMIDILKDMNFKPDLIIEPTCGHGQILLDTAGLFNPNKAIGIEINIKHINELKKKLEPNSIIEVINENIFSYINNIKKLINNFREILFIGNPPWITNSGLGAINGTNLPKKNNLKEFKGIDAITGKSNFDIAENIILNLIESFYDSSCGFAFLCKSIVARNILKYIWIKNLKYENARIYPINSSIYFNVSVDACYLIIDIRKKGYRKLCDIYDSIETRKKIYRYGYFHNLIIRDVDTFKSHDLFGKSHYIWRNGIKHDCSKIMELNKYDSYYINGIGEKVDIEPDLVFPLLKSSDLVKNDLRIRKYVIITQHFIGEDTYYIKINYPKTWLYLETHQAYFEKRKSSIYKKKPKFSIFSVGEYTFSPYKIAISGLYKKIFFKYVSNLENKCVMLDDTCNFIPCYSLSEANFILQLLNSEDVKQFLESVVFMDSKRPFTTEILNNLDLRIVAKKHDIEDKYLEYCLQNKFTIKQPTFRRSIIKKIHFLDMFPQAFNDGDMIRHQFTLDEFQAT